MNTSPPIYQLLKQLGRHISLRRRWQFGWLLILMVLASFAEVFSIGAALPFLAVLTAPDRVFMRLAGQPFMQILGITSPSQLLLPLTTVFGFAVMAAGGTRLLLLWATTRLSFATGADLSNSIYRRTLYQPYSAHIARNSSEVISGISSKADGVIYSVIIPTLTLVSSVVMLFFIMAALLYVDPLVAMATFIGFGMIYALIVGVTRKRLLLNSQSISRGSTKVIKSLQEGLGGIRDVLIDGSQEAYCQIYRSADQSLRRAQGNNLFIGQSPRYGMEALGMLLIASLAYFLARQSNDGMAQAIPVLGAFALGAQRLLPLLQQSYSAWSAVQGGQTSLQDTLTLLDQPLPINVNQLIASPLVFKGSIALKGISFRYGKQTPWVFQNLSMNIKKGDRIGFIGKTGGGKSTLLDIIMGLLQPTEGTLEVDGEGVTILNQRNWQSHIAHVPQTIYLSDSSVAENIAFGVSRENIDYERVRLVAAQAQIANSIEAWSQKYETFVGERGIRLSGGQRQRIGIARALYKRADVIVFDEATSALDNETEESVMQAINALDSSLTVLIIAHRLSTLKSCTQVVELGEGGILHVGSYECLINRSGYGSVQSKDLSAYGN